MSKDPASPGPDEELETGDEAAVGRGLRVSLLLLLVLGVLAGGAWWGLRPKPAATAAQITRLNQPVTGGAGVKAVVPTALFTDVTAAAGIRFRHENGAVGEKLLPETMGGGVAVLDFDGDGDPDLLFVNSSYWPWKKPPGATAPPSGVSLYRNDTAAGVWKFTDVTAGSGLDSAFYGMGVATGDFDNDGAVDVLITGVGGARLYRNLGGGRFEDVTAAAGVGGDPKDWSTAAVWFDFDRDGDLDLYVANYVRWSREIDAEVGYKIDGQARAYGPPMNFQGAFPHLYRNDGGGKFVAVSATAGVQVKNPATGVPAAKSLGVAVVDVNGDGWLDLVVANDTVQNFVFLNRHDGTFREAGAETALAFDSYGNTRGAMGIDAARFTRDGKLAFAIGNFANEMTALYVQQAASTPELPLFADESISWGIGGPSRDPLKFGVFFFDYDLDGRLDLLSVNGHLEAEIAKLQHGQQYAQAAQLFWNAGDAGFLAVKPEQAGPDLFQPIVGRGSAYGDFDGDGDLDVVMTALGGSPVLLRNDQKTGANWVRLRLVGHGSPRDAQGALVKLVAAGQPQWRQVATARSYLSASEPTVTFGLGTATTVDSVEITWPDGRKQSVTGVVAGRVTTIEQAP